MRLLSHPFRLTPAGHAATVEQGTDEGNAELLGALLLTRKGERELVPGFGVSDPAYAGFDPNEIAAAVSAHGPDVRIESVDVEPVDAGLVLVDVRFSEGSA